MATKEESRGPEISNKQMSSSKDVYLKPKRTISSKEKFNEDFREEYNFKKEYVYFSAYHSELIGQPIEIQDAPHDGDVEGRIVGQDHNARLELGKKEGDDLIEFRRRAHIGGAYPVD